LIDVDDGCSLCFRSSDQGYDTILDSEFFC